MATTAAYTEIRAPRWGKEEREYQIVKPKVPYVFSTGANSCLVHKIKEMRLRWWTYAPSWEYLVRLQSPRIMAITNCGQWLAVDTTNAKVCEIPQVGSVPCGMCHGTGRNFPRDRPHEVSKTLAKVRLGCMMRSSD